MMDARTLGKDGVGGSIPLGGTISPYIFCASATRGFRDSAHIGRRKRNNGRTSETESVQSVPVLFRTYIGPMAYLVKFTTPQGRTEIAFGRRHREEAFAQARGAIKDRYRDVELLENGKPVPRSEWAPKEKA